MKRAGLTTDSLGFWSHYAMSPACCSCLPDGSSQRSCLIPYFNLHNMLIILFVKAAGILLQQMEARLTWKPT